MIDLRFEFAGFAAAMTLAMSASVVAQDDFLDVPAEYPTIQSAVDACPEGGTVKLAPGDYPESIEIPAKNFRILGDPSSPATVRILGCCGISAVNADDSFDGWLALEGLSIVGSPGYGVRVDRTGVRMVDCIVSDSSAGGIILLNNASAELLRTTFARNVGRGAYAYVSSNIDAEDCDFVENVGATYGAGIGFHVGSGGSIRSCRFEGNFSPSGQGNDVGLSFSGSRSFTDCTFVRGDDAPGPVWWSEFNGAASCFGSTFCGYSASDISGGFTDLGRNDFNPDGCLPPCLGNFTGDNQVNSADLGILLAYYRNYPDFPEGDLNGDEEIDAADLGILLGSWGFCP